MTSFGHPSPKIKLKCKIYYRMGKKTSKLNSYHWYFSTPSKLLSKISLLNYQMGGCQLLVCACKVVRILLYLYFFLKIEKMKQNLERVVLCIRFQWYLPVEHAEFASLQLVQLVPNTSHSILILFALFHS